MNVEGADMPPINFSKGLNILPSHVKGGLRGAITEQDKESGIVCRICLEEQDPNDMG